MVNNGWVIFQIPPLGQNSVPQKQYRTCSVACCSVPKYEQRALVVGLLRGLCGGENSSKSSRDVSSVSGVAADSKEICLLLVGWSGRPSVKPRCSDVLCETFDLLSEQFRHPC